MAAAYRVTAPYVTLKVLATATGAAQINGFYAGAIVTDDKIEKASLERHLDRRWIERVDEPGEAIVDEPGPDTPPRGPEKPSQADPKAAWVDYAVAQGNDREAVEAMTKADLVELLK